MLKNKFVFLATAALIAVGTAFAQSSVIQTPILDSYTADLLACECSIDHPDAHGVPARVRKSDEMRAKAWATNTAPQTAQQAHGTMRPEAMSANEGSRSKGHGLRPK